MKRIFTLLFLAATIISNAQERCSTTAHTQQLMDINPEYAKARAKVNSQTEQWIKDHPNHSEKTIITIPVVVHVVWNTTAENISDTRIYEQIEILNNDFRRTNADTINPNGQVWWGIAADCEIEFCLATTDPNGQPTTGIERTETTISQFSMWGGSSVKDEAAAWSNDDYLNIWVCDLGSGLLGYATLPSLWIGSTDGVVINYPNFGNSGNSNAPYHKGRTATHEVGHWLNLEHIWGDNNCGNDQITDTPEQKEDNGGCPSFPHNANSCGTANSNGDMFMNYMDYTNDACMNMFTNGQKTRMISAINQYRQNMLSHTLCEGSVGIQENISIKKELIKIVDVLGRETNKQNTNTPLFYIYDDGSVEKKIIIE
jgi:hypothetical protein